MATLSTRLPDCVAFGFRGGAGYNTSISILLSGHEKRNANQSQSRGRWLATHNAKDEISTKELVHFFHAAHGRANNFPFKDWTDYRVVSGEGIVTLVTGSTYQLYKRYSFGGVNRDRKIVRPLNVSITGGGTYSAVNASTGTFTHTGGSAPTGWTGEFDCLCRFDSDAMDLEIINKKSSGENLYTWGGIVIVEDKV